MRRAQIKLDSAGSIVRLETVEEYAVLVQGMPEEVTLSLDEAISLGELLIAFGEAMKRRP